MKWASGHQLTMIRSSISIDQSVYMGKMSLDCGLQGCIHNDISLLITQIILQSIKFYLVPEMEPIDELSSSYDCVITVHNEIK